VRAGGCGPSGQSLELYQKLGLEMAGRTPPATTRNPTPEPDPHSAQREGYIQAHPAAVPDVSSRSRALQPQCLADLAMLGPRRGTKRPLRSLQLAAFADEEEDDEEDVVARAQDLKVLFR
jgi:hypothetical protein